MRDQQAVYLDYAATTPVDARVLEAMQIQFGKNFGNPASVHVYGQKSEAALERARAEMAAILGCEANEIVFTSGGTESDNLALKSAAFAARKARGAAHVLISKVEHEAISQTAEQLADLHDFEVETLPVDSEGCTSPHSVSERIRPDTAVVSVILANNEIGTINPISEIGKVCREQGVPLHTDAVQAGAHLDLDVSKLGVDLLSLGAHKFYGPKGIGALYVRKGTPMVPVQRGGGQEHGMRSGTQNVPLIVGMALAFQLAQAEQSVRSGRLRALRDRIVEEVLSSIPASRRSGHPHLRLPNHASFVFEGVDGNLLITLLDVAGYSCSSGSACKTGDPSPSDVLLALGLSPDWALGSLRVTLGPGTTEEEVSDFLEVLPETVAKARSLTAEKR